MTALQGSPSNHQFFFLRVHPEVVPPRQCASWEVHQRRLLCKVEAILEPSATGLGASTPGKCNRSTDVWRGFSKLGTSH